MAKRFGRVALAGVMLVASAGCRKGVPQPSANSSAVHAGGVEKDLVSRARALLHQQDEALWRAWTEGGPMDLQPSAEEGATLYTREAIARIDEKLQQVGDPLDRRALERLRVYFAGEFLARTVAAQTHALAAAERSLTFPNGDRRHALGELHRVLAREPNALSRQEMYASAAGLADELSPLIDARQRRIGEVLTELGYPTRREFASALRRADLDAIAQMARTILEVTEPTFRNVLEQLAAREIRLPLERVRLRDLPRMFRSRGVDELFPKATVGARVAGTVRGLGLDLSTLPNLRLDDRDLPGKNPRPLALGMEVPGDVRLSVKPAGGLRAQSAYLHEMGHALHAAFTREPRFALAKLGQAGVAEAWSLVFELLIVDPVWLERQVELKGERRDRHLAASAAWDLYRLRRASGHVLYEHALDAGTADPRKAFREVMGRALLLPIEDSDAARWLIEQEEFFASAATIEAEVLAHQLQKQLKARFGPAWWEKREAGDYLQILWAHGNALDARELVRAAGESDLSPEALLLRLTGALKSSIDGSASRDESSSL